MKKELIDLAKYRLNKAKDTLSDGKKYAESATNESTINRIYYSMFYAVNSLLITMGLSSSKHAGVLSIFNREVVNKYNPIFYLYNRDLQRRPDGNPACAPSELPVWFMITLELVTTIRKSKIINNVKFLIFIIFSPYSS